MKMKSEMNFSKLKATTAKHDEVLFSQNIVLIYLIFTNKNILAMLEIRSI